MNRFISLLLVTGLCARALFAADPAPASPAMQSLPANDSRFRYEGRFDRAQPDAPAVIWQASRISIDFEGTALAVRFDWVSDQNFFDVTVDGVTASLGINNTAKSRFVFPRPLAPGRHQLTIFKRTEAAAGITRFRGIEIAEGAHAWVPAAPAYKLRMQFFGDSITAGACNEDSAADQWEDRSTHNNAKSYGAFTAAAFQADYRNIAVSGIGIAAGYYPELIGNVWDRLYPTEKSPRADLTDWAPDVICINYGENDGSFTTVNKQPFPAKGFTAGYVALVGAIRAAYPHAQIVLLRGGMFNGAKHEGLRAAWESAVQQLEAADKQVHHYVFTHWSNNHPRVADDRALADELNAWLKSQDFMAAHK
jgi:lysophospholipase L1-like esterase